MEVNMSQVQIQSASAGLPSTQILTKNQSLAQPLSIPSPASSLPSENAGRPLQNSALPSASVTSTSVAAGKPKKCPCWVSAMLNAKLFFKIRASDYCNKDAAD